VHFVAFAACFKSANNSSLLRSVEPTAQQPLSSRWLQGNDYVVPPRELGRAAIWSRQSCVLRVYDMPQVSDCCTLMMTRQETETCSMSHITINVGDRKELLAPISKAAANSPDALHLFAMSLSEVGRAVLG
jgi:hypothetical protein